MTTFLLMDVTTNPPTRRATSFKLGVLEDIANRQLRTRFGDCDELEGDGWNFAHPRSGNIVDYQIVNEADCDCD